MVMCEYSIPGHACQRNVCGIVAKRRKTTVDDFGREVTVGVTTPTLFIIMFGEETSRVKAARKLTALSSLDFEKLEFHL